MAECSFIDRFQVVPMLSHMSRRLICRTLVMIAVSGMLSSLTLGCSSGSEAAVIHMAPTVMWPGASLCKWDDVREAQRKGFGDSVWTGIKYCGSDANFHYFVDTRRTRVQRGMAVPISELTIDRPAPFSRETESWRDVSEAIDSSSRLILPRLASQ